MKKLISFSVYGPHSLYNDGAYENIAEAEEYFPGWICRFYCQKDAPIVDKLLEEQNKGRCEVVLMPPEFGAKGMFWRFYAFGDPDASHIISRDTDSRLSDKDYKAVTTWVQSNKIAHRIHDDAVQINLKIMGGALGIRGNVLSNIEQLINDWLNRLHGKTIGEKISDTGRTHLLYGADQRFLSDVVWPIICNDCMTHGLLGLPFSPHQPLKWGGDCMFSRIMPFTENKKVFGPRPGCAYESEAKTN